MTGVKQSQQERRTRISRRIDSISRSAPYVLIAGAVVTAVIFTWIVISAFAKAEASIKEQMLSRLQLEAGLLTDIIHEHLEREVDELEGLSQLLSLVRDNEKASREILENYFFSEIVDSEAPMIVALLDGHGNEIYSYPETPIDFIYSPYFISAHQSLSGGEKGLVLGPNYLNQAGPFLTIISPIKEDDRITKPGVQAGSVLVLISLEGIAGSFLGDDVNHLIIDNGKVIYSFSDAPGLAGKTIADESESMHMKYLSAIADDMIKEGKGRSDITIAGENIISGFGAIDLDLPLKSEDTLNSSGIEKPFMYIAIYRHAQALVSGIFQAKRIILTISILLGLILSACVLLGYLILRYQLQESDRSHKVKIDTVHEISGAAAHNLNQPITAIFGYLKMLEMKAESGGSGLVKDVSLFTGRAEKELEKINSIIRKMSEMIDYTTEEYPGDKRITFLEGDGGEIPPEKTDS